MLFQSHVGILYVECTCSHAIKNRRRFIEERVAENVFCHRPIKLIGMVVFDRECSFLNILNAVQSARRFINIHHIITLAYSSHDYS